MTIEWRYLNKASTVRHALEVTDYNEQPGTAACSIAPFVFARLSDWLGTGSQKEYDRIAVLPRCKNCLKVLGKKG